ncbi:hypothetical protein AB0I39_08055 [Kitasatospora purpeofusca]|uniref:hypothetical protein n=1 Tax=Kitasatospora purpeofusca TaxID=67352 RepID=UPI0033D0BD7E
MPKPLSTSGGSPLRHRLLIGLGVLLVVGLLAGLLARLAGGGHTAPPPAGPSPAARPDPTPAPPVGPPDPLPAEAGPTVARPPHTTSPTDFAAAFARTLWTYDATAVTQQGFVSGLRLWLTPEIEYADGASVEGQVPDPVLWSRLRDNAQTSTARDIEARVPATYAQAIANDPTALTRAYIYAVTVTGKVDIAWSDGGRGAEARALTLAVQCRPQKDCTLAAIAPTAYP